MSEVRHGGESRPAQAGKTIFDYADELAVEVPTSCRRTGQCHECVVEISSGMEALCPPTAAEGFLRENYRLACQARIVDAAAPIEFAALRRRPRILEPQSAAPPPGPRDPLAARVGDAVFYDGRRIDDYRGAIFGVAVDLGTTTVVLELVDLETGRTAAVTSFENPQRFGGSDVMNRISYEAEPGAAGELQAAAVSYLNQGIRELTAAAGRRPPTVYEIAVAGNSTMRDILFGWDVQSIGSKPYKSLTEHEFLAGRRPTTALVARSEELGIRANRRARVYGLPLIASHVGADAAACLESVDPAAGGGTNLLVDIGTNTEVILHHRGRLFAASCPAGPAFEGGLVAYGMRAYEGAIEFIRLRPDGTPAEYSTIGDRPAEGLCGSGLIDLLAEVRRHGIMTERGVFADDRRRFQMDVVPERGITFSKQDVGALAQAKAANYCGQMIVMQAAGVQPADVDRLFLAGGFASYINPGNAAAIGLIPPVPGERIVRVGNAAIDGARRVLLSASRRAALEERVKEITHIELETWPDFFDLFVEGCQLKPMPSVFPPSSVSGSPGAPGVSGAAGGQMLAGAGAGR